MTVKESGYQRRANQDLGPEQELFLLCARTRLEGRAEARVRELLEDPLDWDWILSLAGRHHTVTLLHHHVNSTGSEVIPDSVRQDLRGRYFYLAAHTLKHQGELVALARELEAAQAPPVAWKGPVLAHTAYPSPEFRTFTDLDLLFRSDDVGRAREVLRARGYLPQHGPEISEEELFSGGGRDVTFWNPETEVAVDFHWGSVRRYFSSAMDCEQLWPRHRIISLEGEPIRVLEADSMILALCIHGAKHGPFPWPALKWVTDLEALLRTHPTERWAPLLARARSLGCHRMLLLGVLLAKELMEAPVPPAVERDLAKDSVVAELVPPIRARILFPETALLHFSERLRFDLAVRERLRDRIQYRLARLLVPGKRDRSEASSSPTFLQVPRRLGRLAGRYLLHPIRARDFLFGTRKPPDSSGK